MNVLLRLKCSFIDSLDDFQWAGVVFTQGIMLVLDNNEGGEDEEEEEEQFSLVE